MAKLSLQTEPTVEPVSGDELRSHCRITEYDVDTSRDLATLERAARQRVEEITWRALCTQTYDQYFDGFGDGVLKVRKPPLKTLTTVKYTATDGTLTTVADTVYEAGEVNGLGIVRLKYNQDWPTDVRQHPDSVVVRFDAGYGTAASVPWQIKQAIKLLVSHWWEYREPIVGTIVAKVPTSVDSLLGPYVVREVT